MRAGLWQDINHEAADGDGDRLSVHPDWGYIFQLAVDQTVLGVVADGLELYLKEFPDTAITEDEHGRFVTTSAGIFQRNMRVNQLQARLCTLFAEQGITYIILKGQAVARYYPKPMLRCSGDIDFFLDDENYQKAKELVDSMADSSEGEHVGLKHAGYFFGDIEIELHGEETFPNHKRDDFNSLLREVFQQRRFSYYSIGQTQISLAPIDFDVLYVFFHAYRHFLVEGLGMRQLSDLAMLIHSNHQAIDVDKLSGDLTNLRLKDGWSFFMGFLTLFLGLSVDESVVIGKHHSLRKTSVIWKNAKEKGNFGHKNAQLPIADFWRRNLLGFKNAHVGFLNRLQYSPSMAFRFLIGSYMMYIRLGFLKLFHIGGEHFNK